MFGMLCTRPSATRRAGRLLGAATVVAVMAVPFLPALPASADAPGVFVVNSVADAPDAGGTTRNGICATSTKVCTLRAAIQEASAYSGHAAISFALPGVTSAVSPAATITPTSALPFLTNPAGITIDGYTQVGSAPNTAQYGSNAVLKVQIAGPGGSTTMDGLIFKAPSNVVRGLAVYGYQHDVIMEGPSANDSSIVGNFLCTNAAATYRSSLSGAPASGVFIDNGASRNLVGTPALADRNVVSGCAQRGIILGINTTTLNKIQNNLVGLTPSGDAALFNYSHGIDVNYGHDNLVGGTGPNERNIVSGNLNTGIEISHGTSNRHNNVLGNCVGTDITCTKLLSYTGNGQFGIRLEGEGDCAPDSCVLGAGFHEVAYNVVVGNGFNADGPGWGGMMIDKGQNHNYVHDNLIGVLPDGTPAGNIGSGIRVERQAQYNRIGPNNVIANNTKGGIEEQPIGTNPVTSTPYTTIANVFTRNSIYSNGASTGRFGIDLAPLGVANVNGVSDPNTANQVQPPAITGLSATAMSGTACASCVVEAYLADATSATYGEGKTYLASATASSTGAFTLTFPSALNTGQYVTANQTTPGIVDPKYRSEGAFGDTSEFQRNLAVGGVAPPTNVVAPAAINPTNVAAVPVTGTGTDGAVSASGTLTDRNGLSVAAGPVSIDASTSAFALSFNATTLADGPLTASVTLADAASQQSTPTTAGTIKDTVAPTLTATSPTSGATVPSGLSTVTATFSEPLAAGASIALSDGTNSYPGTSALSSDGTTVTYTAAQPLPGGTFTATVTGADPAGNAANATFSFTVDATAPAPTFTLASTINSLTVTITPPGGAVDGYQVVYTPQGGSPVTVNTTSTSVLVGKLPEGTNYSVTVASHTAAGGYGPASAFRTIATKFKSTVTATPNRASAVAVGSPLGLTGALTQTTNSGPISGVKLKIYQVSAADPNQATLLSSTVTTTSSGGYTFSYTPPAGTWKYRVDWQGNSATGTATATTGTITVS